MTLFSTLEDRGIADELALVSHTHQHIQAQTTRLSIFAEQVDLMISQKKTKVIVLSQTPRLSK